MSIYYITAKEAVLTAEGYFSVDLPGKHFEIGIDRQKTGIAEKFFLICPKCNTRRTKLYISTERMELGFLCWKCYPGDFYKGSTHCNPGSRRNIEYRMVRLAEKMGVVIEIPFNPWHPGLEKPRYMRWEKWAKFIRQMTILENMRIQSIGAPMIGIPKKIYSAKTIKYYMDEIMNIDLELEELKQIRDWDEHIP